MIRGIAKEMEIPVADAVFINPVDNVYNIPIDFPVLAKPNFGDSSFGITQKSVANTVEELNDAILKAREQFGYDKPILVEELLTGKDLSLGILGNPPESYTILPIIEEDYSRLPEDLPRICGYEAKWVQDSPYFKLLRSIKADLDPETEKRIIEWSLKLTERLDCRDYTRFDWRLDANGVPKLLEINPNPGWCLMSISPSYKSLFGCTAGSSEYSSQWSIQMFLLVIKSTVNPGVVKITASSGELEQVTLTIRTVISQEKSDLL